MKTKLTLGFSPCPNDTFMFDAMVNGKIDTEELEFEVLIEDIEALNIKVIKSKLDVSKISFSAFTIVTDKYILLTSGSALGNGVGPLLISNYPITISDISKLKIAIPGENTTANFLFSFFFPDAVLKTEMLFSEIEEAVLSGQVDAGVIIHENRFTYQQKGLKKMADLGDLWEKRTGYPIPLGGIVLRKSLPEEIHRKLNRVMRRSVEFAFANTYSGYAFVKQHAQEIDDEVIQKHIKLYVNHFSIDLGEQGRKAIKCFFSKALESGVINSIPENLFVNTSIGLHNV